VEAADHARLRRSKPHARLLGAAAATEIPSPPNTDAPNTLLADLVQQVLREARVRPEEIDGLCTAGCRERIDNTLARWAPARGFARSDLARRTGRLDAAQPLLDLSAAWRNSSASLWLGILSSPEGQHEVVLLKRFDR